MLYYILPPIVIVISVAILIFFLFRKVEQLPAQELLKRAEETGVVRSSLSKVPSVLGQFGLRVLEKMMQRFKLLSLKIHNLSNVWFHTIRKKREQGVIANKLKQEKTEMVSGEKKNFFAKYRTPGAMNEKVAFDTAGEEAEYPIQRGRMTYPSTQRQIVERERVSAMVKPEVRPEPAKIVRQIRKDQLEEVLIKRIAINPKDIEAYERLGDYYIEQANLTDSLECYKQVLKLSPTHQKAKTKVRRIERSLQ